MRLTHPARRYLSSQAARPTGAFGRLLGRIWRAETADVNRIAVELLAPGPGERVCEIGFGPGRTLGLLAAAGASERRRGVDDHDRNRGPSQRESHCSRPDLALSRRWSNPAGCRPQP